MLRLFTLHTRKRTGDLCRRRKARLWGICAILETPPKRAMKPPERPPFAGGVTFTLPKNYMAPALYSGKEYLASAVSLPVILPILSQAQWLRGLDRITTTAATNFDKAMDSRYLETYIGGGNHRMFDGGHTLGGAWGNIAKMCGVAKCSTGEQANGYLNAIWKDLVTPKGLPFVTMEKQTYDSLANWMSKTIPGVNKQWVYDAFSYDALEILSAGISAAAVIYYLDKGQVDKLSELLGSMGIVSIVSANPILAMVVISSVAYALATGS